MPHDLNFWRNIGIVAFVIVMMAVMARIAYRHPEQPGDWDIRQ